MSLTPIARSAFRAPILLAPSESQTLALAASREAAIELAQLEERQYAGGEFKLRPLQSVRGRTVFVLQTLAGTPDAPITQRLVRLLFLLQGLRDAGAARIVALLPYLAFARKDRRTKPRDPVYMRYMAQLIEAAGADHVLTLDVHNAAAFDNAFRIPADHLSALPLMAAHFIRHLDGHRIAVASPDIGGIKRAQSFRDLLERDSRAHVELLFIEKRRTGGKVSAGAIVGNAEDLDVIVLDDLCATGATLIQAATALREAGAHSINVAVTHTPVESGVAALLATPGIRQIVVTDSVGEIGAVRQVNTAAFTAATKHVLSIAPLLGNAIARMIHGESLAPLLERWPAPRD